MLDILITAAPYIVSVMTLLGVWLKLRHTEKLHKQDVQRATSLSTKTASICSSPKAMRSPICQRVAWVIAV